MIDHLKLTKYIGMWDKYTNTFPLIATMDTGIYLHTALKYIVWCGHVQQAMPCINSYQKFSNSWH